jgi:nucleotide-binding universal stress UspA family protein
MDRMAELLRDHGCSASALLIQDVQASTAILHELEDERYKLVVVQPHRGGRIRELFLGSTAHAVLRGARVPVLVVGPGA